MVSWIFSYLSQHWAASDRHVTACEFLTFRRFSDDLYNSSHPPFSLSHFYIQIHQSKTAAEFRREEIDGYSVSISLLKKWVYLDYVHLWIWVFLFVDDLFGCGFRCLIYVCFVEMWCRKFVRRHWKSTPNNLRSSTEPPGFFFLFAWLI